MSRCAHCVRWSLVAWSHIGSRGESRVQHNRGCVSVPRQYLLTMAMREWESPASSASLYTHTHDSYNVKKGSPEAAESKPKVEKAASDICYCPDDNKCNASTTWKCAFAAHIHLLCRCAKYHHSTLISKMDRKVLVSNDTCAAQAFSMVYQCHFRRCKKTYRCLRVLLYALDG